MEYVMIITTCETVADAKEIATDLLMKKLVACVQIHGVDSLYYWKGEVANDKEQILFIKTKKSLYEEVEKAILKIHKYETPEIIALPITAGSDGYLSWINDVTK